MFITTSLFKSCTPTEKDVFLSRKEKTALAADILLVIASIIMSLAIFYNAFPIQIPLISYCLWGVVGVVALLDVIKLLNRYGRGKDHRVGNEGSEHNTTAHIRDQQANNRSPNSSPLEINDSLQTFLSSYNEDPVVTLGPPCSVAEALGRFKNREDIKRQGVELEQSFYYQRARGGGNCFYLAYLSSFLHHLVMSKNFDQMIDQIKNNSFQCMEKKIFIDELEKLKTSPCYTTLYKLFKDTSRMASLTSYLRQFANFYVLHLKEKMETDSEGQVSYKVCPIDYEPASQEKYRFVWGNDELFGVDTGNGFEGGIIQDNEDLRKGVGIFSRENYCKYQNQDGVDIQRPEIGMLNDYFFSVRMYQRMDIEMSESTKRQSGLNLNFSTNSPVVVFRCPNHFDCLIPKR